MGAKKSKLNKEVLDELCSKTKFRNYFRDSNVRSYSQLCVPRNGNMRMGILLEYENVLRVISIRHVFCWAMVFYQLG